MLEAFLRRLAEEATQGLEANEIPGFVAEAREHLEDSIQARIELGMSPEEAEREALRAFGGAEEIGAAIERLEPRSERTFLIGSTGMVLLFGVLLKMSLAPLMGVLSLIAFSALFASILWGSFHAKRIQIVTIGVLFAATLGVSSLRAAATMTTTSDTHIAHRRSEIANDLASAQGWTRRHEGDLERFKADYAHFVRGGATSAPGIAFRPNDLKFDRWAEWALMDRIVQMTVTLKRDRMEELQLREAAGKSWRAQLPDAPASVFQEVWPPFLALSLVHLFAWTCGAAWRIAKRRRPPTRTA